MKLCPPGLGGPVGLRRLRHLSSVVPIQVITITQPGDHHDYQRQAQLQSRSDSRHAGPLAALEESGQTPQFFITRHVRGDWGEVCESDKRLNDQALVDGSRLLSAYRTLKGERIDITEATDDQGNRAATTVLTPAEY